MSRTGNQLLTDLSRYIGDLDFPEGLETTGAGSSTSLVDTALSRFGDDFLNDWYVRVTESVNGNQYLARRITDFTSSTGTCTLSPAFAGATASGTTYELHRISPHEKFSALDEARITCFPALGTLVYYDQLTSDGETTVYNIPSTMRRGPVDIYVECPVSTGDAWNLLGSPIGNSTTVWSASSVTASTVSYSESDNVVPKYNDGNATKIVVAGSTAGTYTQTVANMANGITAAAAAGRGMTFAMWVYSRVSSAVRLGITDDSGTTYGSYHSGNGWQLLTVEDTIVGTNATTLSAVIDFASTTARVHYWNHGWFYFGAAEKVTESWTPAIIHHVRRDNTTQHVHIDEAPERGLQIRLVGRGLLTALGTTASTQATNTMEVDEAEAELLVAEAAKVLMRRGLLTSAAMDGLAVPLQANEATLRDLKSKWAQNEVGPRMRSMFG